MDAVERANGSWCYQSYAVYDLTPSPRSTRWSRASPTSTTTIGAMAPCGTSPQPTTFLSTTAWVPLRLKCP